MMREGSVQGGAAGPRGYALPSLTVTDLQFYPDVSSSGRCRTSSRAGIHSGAQNNMRLTCLLNVMSATRKGWWHRIWAHHLDEGTYYHVSMNMCMKYMQAKVRICTSVVFEICIPVMLHSDHFSCICKRKRYWGTWRAKEPLKLTAGQERRISQ